MNKTEKLKNKTDIALPYSKEIEMDFLSCIVSAETEDNIYEMMSDLSPVDFYTKECKTIFEACYNLIFKESVQKIDSSILVEELRKSSINVDKELTTILANYKAFEEAQKFKDKIIDFSYARDVIVSCRSLIEEASKTPEYQSLLASFENKVDKITIQKSDKFGDVFTASEAVASYIKERDENKGSKGNKLFRTGINKLDGKLNQGLRGGAATLRNVADGHHAHDNRPSRSLRNRRYSARQLFSFARFPCRQSRESGKSANIFSQHPLCPQCRCHSLLRRQPSAPGLFYQEKRLPRHDSSNHIAHIEKYPLLLP